MKKPESNLENPFNNGSERLFKNSFENSPDLNFTGFFTLN